VNFNTTELCYCFFEFIYNLCLLYDKPLFFLIQTQKNIFCYTILTTILVKTITIRCRKQEGEYYDAQ